MNSTMQSGRAAWVPKSVGLSPNAAPSRAAALRSAVGNQAVLRQRALLQRARDGSADGLNMTRVRSTTRAPGRPLAPLVRSAMEAAFGADFSAVRLHDDHDAAASARDVGARAYTVGQHIVLAGGALSGPTQSSLLAHELAHVQQAGATDLEGPIVVGSPGTKAEREADVAASRAVAGAPVSVSPADSCGIPVLRRAVDDRAPQADVSPHEFKKAPRSSVATPVGSPSALEQRVEHLELESKRSSNRSRAIFHLDSFREEVMRRATSWQRAALRVGSAYALAADDHKSTLEKQAKLEALGDQAFFSVLTIATAGGLSWLSSWLQATEFLKEGKLLTNVLEDTMQAAGGEAFSAMGVQLSTPTVSPVGINPQVFQNDRVDAILAAVQSAHAYFAKVSGRFHSAPPEFWDGYDEAHQREQFDSWLSQASLLKGEESLPDRVTMEFELVRAFWAEWVQGLAIRTLGYAPSVFGYGKKHPGDIYNLTKYSYPGRVVEARLDELRIAEEAGISDFGWWTSETEIDKLVAWGRAYKIRPFVPLPVAPAMGPPAFPTTLRPPRGP